jgi:uncharacterized membrane protein
VTALLNKLKDDAVWLAAGVIIIGVILKVLFPASGILAIAKMVLGIAWVLVLPGYCMMLPWQNTIELKERIVVGMLAAAGLFAIASYYFGIAGLHIRYHTLLFPTLTALAAVILLYSKKFMKRAQASQ